jgi:hypothetical protein
MRRLGSLQELPDVNQHFLHLGIYYGQNLSQSFGKINEKGKCDVGKMRQSDVPKN